MIKPYPLFRRRISHRKGRSCPANELLTFGPRRGCGGIGRVDHAGARRGDSGGRSFASVRARSHVFRSTPSARKSKSGTGSPKMAVRGGDGCFGLTEPDYGSNPAGIDHRREGDERRRVLNGARCGSPNGSTAQLAIVWARPGRSTSEHRFAASSSRRTPRASRPRTRKGKSVCAPATRASWCCRTCASPTTRCSEDGRAQSPCCASPRRARHRVGAVGAAMACYDEAVSYARPG